MSTSENEAAAPTLHLSPDRPLLDEEVTVRITGLAGGERVELDVRERKGDDVYGATATFAADADGAVDLTDDAPVAGDYDGVRPMGLFQFQRERPDADPSTVSPEESNQRDGSSDDALTFPGELRATVDGRVVDAVEYERVVRPAAVTKREIEHPDLVGDRYLPAGDGPHPGVLWFGGSEGGRPGEVTASLLAARGYAVLGLAYFGVEGLPDHLVDVPVEYFETAVEWFGDREAVRSEPLAAMSVSRGSEMALHLGATHDAVRTVVVRAPSDVRYGGIWTGQPEEWGPPGAAWTRDGDPPAYVPVASSPFDVVRWFLKGLLGRAVEIDHTYVDGRREVDDATLDEATIPVEETGGPVLLISGDDDRLWPSTEMAENIVERLEGEGFDHRFEHHSYPDAGHAISPPYRPVVGRETSPFLPRVEMALGGTPDGYAAADADSWPRIRDVLADGLE